MKEEDQRQGLRKPSKTAELRLRHDELVHEAETWGVYGLQFRHFWYTRYRRHQYLRYRITLAFFELDGLVHCAISACSPKDQFNKRLGRVQAMARLINGESIAISKALMRSDLWPHLITDIVFYDWDQEEKRAYAYRSIMADAPAIQEPESD